jgi:hypothetical protein
LTRRHRRGEGLAMESAPLRRRAPLAVWRHLYVRVALSADRQGADYRVALDKLRRLETWLAANHRPIALFGADGLPKGEAVSVFFERAEAAKALAYRTLCNELGLGGTLLAGLVVHAPDPRTVPPA